MLYEHYATNYGQKDQNGVDMNYFKWLICCGYKSHILTYFTDKNGKRKRICVRCGIEKDV